MPRVNIWLPEHLHARVKDADIPVSEVCQRALHAELEKREHRHTTISPDRTVVGEHTRRQ
jgi:post-segregation antitoxin (ccd killing protein)